MVSEPTLASRYDVVIVGGRPAGASLAARLAEHDVSTLVIDRAHFPSHPAVPSCGVLYPPAMALVDELGIDQSEFGDESVWVRRMMVDVDGRYDVEFDMIESHGRDYIYGIDRVRFDQALWRNLRRHPQVTAVEGTSFLDVVADAAGSVTGVKIKTADGSLRSIEAGCVVGADGRFSPVARTVGAKIREDFTRTSTVHFAAWEGVLPHDDDPRALLHVYTNVRGSDVLFFPLPEGRIHICTHLRTDRVDMKGATAEDFYLRTLRSFPGIARRIGPATRVGRVIGLKRVANRYRESGGPGWVLVGDALHHKDPIDGQGIYDAMSGAKILTEELVSWHAGGQSFARALESYERRVMAQTRPMFTATTERLTRELYQEPPAILVGTAMRWLMNDARYKRTFLAYLCRDVDPTTWLTPSLVAGAMARGVLGDLRRAFGRRSPS